MLNCKRSFLLTFWLAALVLLAQGACGYAADTQEPWRIRFLEAAIVSGPLVKLGEVAVPVGDMPPEKWAEFSRRELWPAPPVGKAVNMTRPRLQEAVVRTMQDLAPYCLFPGSMALQQGGVVIGKESIQQTVEKELRPFLSSLPGEASFKDFRLPLHVFMEHPGQVLSVEQPKKIAPGRLNVRLTVREMDGTVKQKLSGSVFVDCWADVPCAVVPLNKEDLLEHDRVTFIRTNLASLRSDPWDGRGGPWRIMRPIAVEQVIYQSDLAHIPTVRKGSTVTLLYEGKSVRLTVQAEAMADGAPGESIAVRNLQSKKEVYGVVRDASTVTVNTTP